MGNWKFNSKRGALIAGISLLCAVGTTACGSGPESAVPTPQGTIPLESVKVGMPESTFTQALLTFVPDPKGAVGGKTQYLSRPYDANGGQYVAQCRDGRCFMLQVYFSQAPVSKQIARQTLDRLFPAEAPPQAGVDDKEVKAAASNTPTERLYFGKSKKGGYIGEFVYSGKDSDKVSIVNLLSVGIPHGEVEISDSNQTTQQ